MPQPMVTHQFTGRLPSSLLPNGDRDSLTQHKEPTSPKSQHSPDSIHSDDNNFSLDRHSYSCKRCRRLKKKCSRASPECQNCAKAGESCEYIPRAPRRKKIELEGHSERSEAHAPSVNTQTLIPQQTLPSVVTRLNTLSPSRLVSAFSTFDQQRPSLPPLSSITATIPKRPYLAPTPQSGLKSYTARQLPSFQIQHAYISNIIHAPTTSPNPPTPHLPNDLLTRCVDRFFEDYAKTYPFLNHAHFCESYNPLAHAFQESHFEVNMAVLLGYLSLLSVNKVSNDLQLKAALKERALGDVAKFVETESLESLKRLLYYGMYTLLDKNGDASWYICGIIGRMALSLGLNRESPDGTAVEQEDRKRVFWSCYNFDRVVCVGLGRPEALNDVDIDVEELKPRVGEDPDLVELMKAVVRLRTLEGHIMKEVHSPIAGGRLSERPSQDEKQATLQRLRLEIEAWYNRTSLITCSDRKVTLTSCTTSWYSSVYYYLLSLLYRPSFLIPSPEKDTLQLLGRCCLQSATFTHNLHTLHQLPMHWIQLNKMITHCTTLIYCLCNSSLDLVEARAEVNLCMELLEHFALGWSVATQVLDLFWKINAKVHDYRSKGLNEEGFGMEFRALGAEYCDVLVRNGYDVKFDEPVILGIRMA